MVAADWLLMYFFLDESNFSCLFLFFVLNVEVLAFKNNNLEVEDESFDLSHNLFSFQRYVSYSCHDLSRNKFGLVGSLLQGFGCQMEILAFCTLIYDCIVENHSEI